MCLSRPVPTFILQQTEILKFNFSFVSERTGDNGKFQEQFPNNNNNNEGMGWERNTIWSQQTILMGGTTEDPIKWFNECSSESDAERKHKKDHEAFFNLIISLSYFSDKRFRISISPRSYFALWELSKVKQTESRAVEPQGDRRAHLQSKLSSRRHADTGWMLTEHIWLHLFRTEEQMEELLMSGDWGRWRGRRRRRSTLATRWSSRESSGWR